MGAALHPDLPVDVQPLGDVDPTGTINEADPIGDKGDGLTSFNFSNTGTDPSRHWQLVPADAINRAQRLTASEIRGEIAGYRSTIPIPYGTVRVPGKITAIYHQSGNFYFVFAIALGPVTDINKCWWNGVEVSMSFVANGQYDGDLPEAGDINIYDGTQTYVDPKLLLVNINSGGFTQYTSTHEGYCYAAVEVPATLVDQLPRLEVELDGLALYDQRLNSGSGGTAFSDNPALIVADLLSNTSYGAGQTMDWDSVDTAADYLEEQVGGENRFECDMALQRPRPIPEWVGVLSAYGNIYVDATGSTVKFVVDKPRDAVATFGPGKIIQGSTRWEKDLGARHPDDVVVEWFDATEGRLKLAYAIGNQSSPLEEFIRMPGFTSHSQAKRFAVTRLNQIRLRDLSYTVDVSNEGMQLSLGDRIQLTDGRWPIQNKAFIVTGITIPREGVYRLALIEYQPNAYSDAVETEPVIDDYGLPGPFDYPTDINFNYGGRTQSFASNGDVLHHFNWTIPNPQEFPFVTAYRLQVGFDASGSSGDNVILGDFIIPRQQGDNTTFLMTTRDYVSGVLDAYLTVLTPYRKSGGIDWEGDDSFSAGGSEDAANGIYWTGWGFEDDPTPDPVPTLSANEIANNVAGVAGVWVAWEYDNRPNYVRRFRVRIYNITQASYELTTTTSGRNTLVSSSGWNSTSDSYRAEVEAENRSGDYSPAAQSAAFTVSTVA